MTTKNINFWTFSFQKYEFRSYATTAKKTDFQKLSSRNSISMLKSIRNDFAWKNSFQKQEFSGYSVHKMTSLWKGSVKLNVVLHVRMERMFSARGFCWLKRREPQIEMVSTYKSPSTLHSSFCVPNKINIKSTRNIFLSWSFMTSSFINGFVKTQEYYKIQLLFRLMAI